MNSFEQYKKNINFIDINNEKNYENEKDIENKCKIKINNVDIQFDFVHKFDKKGKKVPYFS